MTDHTSADAFSFQEIEPADAPAQAWEWVSNISMFAIGVFAIAT